MTIRKSLLHCSCTQFYLNNNLVHQRPGENWTLFVYSGLPLTTVSGSTVQFQNPDVTTECFFDGMKKEGLQPKRVGMTTVPKSLTSCTSKNPSKERDVCFPWTPCPTQSNINGPSPLSPVTLEDPLILFMRLKNEGSTLAAEEMYGIGTCKVSQ